MDEEYDVIVLGTGLTVSSRASSAFFDTLKTEVIARSFHIFFFNYYFSQTHRPAILQPSKE